MHDVVFLSFRNACTVNSYLLLVLWENMILDARSVSLVLNEWSQLEKIEDTFRLRFVQLRASFGKKKLTPLEDLKHLYGPVSQILIILINYSTVFYVGVNSFNPCYWYCSHQSIDSASMSSYLSVKLIDSSFIRSDRARQSSINSIR